MRAHAVVLLGAIAAFDAGCAELLAPDDPRILFVGGYEMQNCTASCRDKTIKGGARWTDSDGDSCQKITTKEWCPWAADYRAHGLIATEACCGCGGGVKEPCIRSTPVAVFGW